MNILLKLFMKQFINSTTIYAGLAIFSMLFGAGNLVYPVLVGMQAGEHYIIGITGFILTAVCLPVVGLISMIFFNGSYDKFFGRLGFIPGKACVYLCMLIIGPLLAIPRIVTLSHTMTAPFLPSPLNHVNPLSSFIFSIIFLGFTFLGTFRKNKIVNILGLFISPLLIISLLIIIIKGILSAEPSIIHATSPLITFKENVKLGYATLDLLGTIFFASIVLSSIARSTKKQHLSHKEQAVIGLKAGIFGASLLATIYVGINYLGVYHAHGIEYSNIGELFREVAFKILSHNGGLIISLAVFMACYSTAVSLTAVIATFIRREIFVKKINFVSALLIGLIACLPLSTAGLGTVLNLTAGPLTYIGYPALIMLTFLNLTYKLFGFRPVKLPVLATFLFMLIHYLYRYV